MRRMKQRCGGFERSETSKLKAAQGPHALPSPQMEDSPVFFTQTYKRPSVAASDMISLGGSVDEMDDSLSLAELSGSGNDPALLPQRQTQNRRGACPQDLALSATKATAKAIGWSMFSLVVLERHLWLTLMEMKEADKVPFLNAPVSSNSLFAPAVEGFAEQFTEA